MTHGDVRHDNVLHPSLVNHLKGQTTAPHTRTVGYRDVAVSAVALGSQLDASANPVDDLRDISAIEKGAQLIARNHTVGDQDMLAEDGPLQGIRALEHNGVVAGRVHLGVAHGEVFAAVDVNAVAVGVNHDIVDCPYLTSSDDDGKMASPVDGDVTDGHVAAQLEGNSLVARALSNRPAHCRPFSVSCFVSPSHQSSHDQ